MKETENRRYEADIMDEKNEMRIWLSASLLNVGKEKSEKIICEIEEAKERIKKILAG